MFKEKKEETNNIGEKVKNNEKPIIEKSNNNVESNLPFSEASKENNSGKQERPSLNKEETNNDQKQFTSPSFADEKLRKKFSWKLAALISGLVLIIGGFCAVYFTDLKYKIPFFQAEESELVGMMYERFKEFKSSDFTMNFLVEVADRTDKFSKLNKKSNFGINLINPAKAITSYTIEDITTNIGLEKTNENSNSANSDMLSFFSGETFEEYEKKIGMYLAGESRLNLTFSGSGFDLSKVKEKNELPDVEMVVNGDFKTDSMTMLIDLAGKLIKDNVYYKVSEFPYIDITQGHQGEWIKASSMNEEINDFVSKVEEKGEDFINKARDFISKTRDKKLLIFKQTGNKVKIEGIEAPEFEVEINSEVVPDWIKSIQNDNSNTNISKIINISQKELTQEEENEIKQKIEKAMKNIRIKVALHPGTGDLMQLSFNSRIVPPEDLKIYKDKQINMGFTVKMWNHNNPSKVKVPSSYVDADEIEREKLGLSKEAYRDRKQAEKVLFIREKLMEYYIENKKFPDKLSKVTRNTKDLNTEKDYIYEVKGNNYSLEYNMNDVEQEPKPSEKEYTSYGILYSTNSKEGIGINSITNEKNEWRKGKNIADRYSPITDQIKEKSNFVKKGVEKSNYDVLVAKEQSKIVHRTKDLLSRYKAKYETFPETINKLEEAVNNNEIYYYDKSDGYMCEDLLKGEFCQYMTENDNKTYKFDINFDLGIEDISSEASLSFRHSLDEFVSGKNTFIGGSNFSNTNINTNSNNVDMDNDGDGDGIKDIIESYLGSNKYKKDTDGDGYDDKTEYYGGYNIMGEGKSIIGAWSECVNLTGLETCSAYCQSIGKTCTSEKAVTSQGIYGKPAETWNSAADCKNGATSAGYNNCYFNSKATDARWKCFCK
ncbi:MAG: hypothetical protein U5L76_00520 [Patescibacteria group bacterium]|nr:hypothetical protein [Patescibacteria group bacterium]